MAKAAGIARVANFRTKETLVRHNPGASLVDLCDGVACLELHSKKNAIGEDIVRLVTETLRSDGDAVRNFEAFVIGGDADNFSEMCIRDRPGAGRTHRHRELRG